MLAVNNVFAQLTRSLRSTVAFSTKCSQHVGTITPSKEQIATFNKACGDAEAGEQFQLANGTLLPKDSLQIKFASFGASCSDVSKCTKPVILLCPSMSNSVFAMDQEGGEQGWWRKVIGSGDSYGIDISQFTVVCGAPIGSPFGSTSPLTVNPETEKPWGPTFPEITPQDQARVQALLLQALGIEKVFAVIGGSMGGMQALQFATNFPEKYDRFVAIASTGQTSPGTVALRSVQRAAVMTDPEYNDGHYVHGKGPSKGMAIARMFGTICYRSHSEFDGRFNWYPQEEEDGSKTFEIERYLRYQAEKFVSVVNYDANCYLVNSKSMDLMDLGAGSASFEEGARRIPKSKQGLLLSYSTDRLTPPQDLEKLSSVLGRKGVEVHFEVLNSKYGHDAFLIAREAVHLNFRLRAFLETNKGHYDGNGVHNVQALVKDLHHN